MLPITPSRKGGLRIVQRGGGEPGVQKSESRGAARNAGVARSREVATSCSGRNSPTSPAAGTTRTPAAACSGGGGRRPPSARGPTRVAGRRARRRRRLLLGGELQPGHPRAVTRTAGGGVLGAAGPAAARRRRRGRRGAGAGDHRRRAPRIRDRNGDRGCRRGAPRVECVAKPWASSCRAEWPVGPGPTRRIARRRGARRHGLAHARRRRRLKVEVEVEVEVWSVDVSLAVVDTLLEDCPSRRVAPSTSAEVDVTRRCVRGRGRAVLAVDRGRRRRAPFGATGIGSAALDVTLVEVVSEVEPRTARRRPAASRPAAGAEAAIAARAPRRGRRRSTRGRGRRWSGVEETGRPGQSRRAAPDGRRWRSGHGGPGTGRRPARSGRRRRGRRRGPARRRCRPRAPATGAGRDARHQRRAGVRRARRPWTASRASRRAERGVPT